MKTLGTIIIAAALVGCTTVQSKSPKHIDISYDAMTPGESYRLAEEHCAQYGKVAVPAMVHGDAFAGLLTKTFRCE